MSYVKIKIEFGLQLSYSSLFIQIHEFFVNIVKLGSCSSLLKSLNSTLKVSIQN